MMFGVGDSPRLMLLGEPLRFEEGFWLMTAPGDHVPRKVRVFRDYLVEWFRHGANGGW
jgi:DNA-binding transcriptional LysR family regulator